MVQAQTEMLCRFLLLLVVVAVMSQTEDSMLSKVKSIIPALESSMHKGQAGRLAIIGGSQEYTGAPYYSAMSTLRCGGDLAFVFCGNEKASQPIKSYSPELIVYSSILPHFAETLPRLSSAVFGPGLGRDPEVMKTAAQAILLARQVELPIVLDGDALWLLKDMPELLRGYRKAVITPNAVEFDRLLQAANITRDGEQDFPKPSTSPDGIGFVEITNEPALSVAKLARWLGGCTVMKKGKVDLISNGEQVVGLAAFGSPRRCGGQGDVLAGTCGVFLGWTKGENPVEAAFGASLLTRKASALAFATHGRSMTTPDLIHNLGGAFHQVFENNCSL